MKAAAPVEVGVICESANPRSTAAMAKAWSMPALRHNLPPPDVAAVFASPNRVTLGTGSSFPLLTTFRKASHRRTRMPHRCFLIIPCRLRLPMHLEATRVSQERRLATWYSHCRPLWFRPTRLIRLRRGCHLQLLKTCLTRLRPLWNTSIII